MTQAIAAPLIKEVKPQPGPQIAALESRADILIYGGEAGSGKSWLLVHEPLRRIHNPGYRAIFFRRTFPQLTGQGGLWDECQELYRAFGARMREGQDLDATFPGGANVCFRHLQHEKDKYDHQGRQYTAINFDELTHFSATQFWYLLSRNRSTCGIRPYVRATCNPEPGWVADFLAWWIDQETGYAIPERSGVVRWMARNGDDLIWGDSPQGVIEIARQSGIELVPDDCLSVTFILALLDDNKILLQKDPGYRARLKALPKIERDRLLGEDNRGGNWKVARGGQVNPVWPGRYLLECDGFKFRYLEHDYTIPQGFVRRIATIDTAGTSKELAAEAKGRKKASWSVCGVWDIVAQYYTAVNNRQVILNELMFLRHVWRKQVEWVQLKQEIDDVLGSWNVEKAYVENAHFGPALVSEIRSTQCELIGPVIAGMRDHGEDAKLERAIASGMLSRFERGKIFLPTMTSENADWLQIYLKELLGWTGLPGEEADQIDMTSYAAYVSKQSSTAWGGVIPQKRVR